MKLTRNIIIVAVMAALLLAGAALAEGTMTVQGVGTVKVDADRVNISLGVREVAPDVAKAQGSVNEKIASVIEALKEKGVGADAISTAGLGVYPNYDYSSYDGSETITGYTAYNTIYLLLSDVNNSGAYIDAAFAAGANSLDYVEFAAADTAEAADRALTLAVENAKEKAGVLARAAGVELGDITEIQEIGSNSYEVNTLFARSEEADKGAGTEVLASKQSVTAAVNVTYAIGE